MEFKFEVGDKIGSVWGVGKIANIIDCIKDRHYGCINIDLDKDKIRSDISVMLIQVGYNTYKTAVGELPQIWPLDSDGVNRYPREPEIDHEKEFWFGRRVMALSSNLNLGFCKVVSTGEIDRHGRFVCMYSDPDGVYLDGTYDEVKYEDWADE